MNRLQRLSLAIATAVLMTVCATVSYPAAAETLTNDHTVFTTEKPLRIAKTVLPPGTYEFHIYQKTGVLEVLDHRTKAVVANAFTVPHERNPFFEVEASNEFVYYPLVPELPQTLRTWFPANTMLGRDIVTPGSVVSEIQLALSRQRGVQEEQVAQVQPPAPPAVVEEQGTAVTEPAPLIAENRTPERQLPLTASNTPLYVFLGLASVLGATLVSAYRKVSS